MLRRGLARRLENPELIRAVARATSGEQLSLEEELLLADYNQVTAGLKDVRVETITEKLTFQSGQQLWDWLVNSNPIVEMVLGDLSLTADQRVVIRGALEVMVRKRAGDNGSAVLTNPINIGVGTK